MSSFNKVQKKELQPSSGSTVQYLHFTKFSLYFFNKSFLEMESGIYLWFGLNALSGKNQKLKHNGKFLSHDMLLSSNALAFLKTTASLENLLLPHICGTVIFLPHIRGTVDSELNNFFDRLIRTEKARYNQKCNFGKQGKMAKTSWHQTLFYGPQF